MAYNKQTWAVEELAKPLKMRHMEDGIAKAIENPEGGEVGNVLKKTATGTEWGTIQAEGAFIVTFENNEGDLNSNKTAAEIAAAAEAGKLVVGIEDGQIEYLLIRCEVNNDEYLITFGTSSVLDNAQKVESISIDRGRGTSTKFYKETFTIPSWSEASDGDALVVNPDTPGLEWRELIPNDGELGQILKIGTTGKMWVDVGSAISFNTAYNASTNKAATMSDVNVKQNIPSQVTTGTDITLADNTEYRLTNVSNLTLSYPQGNFECWMRITTASSGTISVNFPSTTRYIGNPPLFEANETWEISVKDGIVVAVAVNE